MMIGHEFLPDPKLHRFVQSYQLRHFISPPGTHIPFKPYAPRPEQTLAFFPRGSERVENLVTNTMLQRPRSAIIGQYSERTNRHLTGLEFCVLHVNFHPGVLYRLTGMPFSELTNTFADAEDVLPKEIRRVNDRLNSTESPQEMIGIVERLLLELTGSIQKDAHPIDIVTNQLILHPEDALFLFKFLHDRSQLGNRLFEALLIFRSNYNNARHERY